MPKPIVLITGTSSGFGMLASMELARRGYHIIATMRNSERETSLHTYIKKQNITNIEITELDVTNHNEMPKKVAEILASHGRIDTLINNAGYAEGGLVEDVSIKAYRKQLETNFFGLVAMTKSVIPHMRKQKSGKIINISSVSGRSGFPALSPYVSSKFAVEGFSECLRLEMLPYGIYVTLIEPGPYKTAIWDKGFVDKDISQISTDKILLKNILIEIETIARNANNPREVIDTLTRVIKLKRPRLRYIVGRGTKRLLFLKRFIPEKLFEQIVLKRIKG